MSVLRILDIHTTMKTALISILAITVILCGCATTHNTGRTNGYLHVTIHVPDDLVGQPVATYANGQLICNGTGLTETLSLLPKRMKIRIEMAGTKPFEQTLDIPGNGSKQDLDVTLVKP
jgi:hypothetical protein